MGCAKWNIFVRISSDVSFLNEMYKKEQRRFFADIEIQRESEYNLYMIAEDLNSTILKFWKLNERE